MDFKNILATSFFEVVNKASEWVAETTSPIEDNNVALLSSLAAIDGACQLMITISKKMKVADEEKTND